MEGIKKLLKSRDKKSDQNTSENIPLKIMKMKNIVAHGGRRFNSKTQLY
jgi:hypothetical protein